MNYYNFIKVSLSEITSLRKEQINDLKSREYDPLEETIKLSEVICLKIQLNKKDIGYALIDIKSDKGIVLLEFYLIYSHRSNSKTVFNELVQAFNCDYWYVNSNDSFSLPLLLENRFLYNIDCLIFSHYEQKHENENNLEGITIDLANMIILQDTYNLIMQDDFYTGNGLEGLANYIEDDEIYLLKKQGRLIGVGFVSQLVRTPSYADIAMIIDKQHRRKGYASFLVSQLIKISLSKNLIPTALTSIDNIASRKTLEKYGFYLDGCMLLSKITR